MAKQSGLGDNLYVAQYDLSGDIGSVGSISGGPSTLEVTGINKSAYERIGGKRDGSLEFVSFFNPAAGQAHPALSSLPTTDRVISYLRGTTLGNPAASMVAKQIGYDPTRNEDGSLTFKVAAQANGYGLEWGHNLTAGILSLASTGAGTGVDDNAAATSLGMQAYLHVFSIGSGTATVAVQDFTSDTPASYADITGGVFSATTTATSERIATAADQAIRRWLRVNVTGTFTNLDFAVVVVRNLTAVSF